MICIRVFARCVSFSFGVLAIKLVHCLGSIGRIQTDYHLHVHVAAQGACERTMLKHAVCILMCMCVHLVWCARSSACNPSDPLSWDTAQRRTLPSLLLQEQLQASDCSMS